MYFIYLYTKFSFSFRLIKMVIIKMHATSLSPVTTEESILLFRVYAENWGDVGVKYEFGKMSTVRDKFK